MVTQTILTGKNISLIYNLHTTNEFSPNLKKK